MNHFTKTIALIALPLAFAIPASAQEQRKLDLSLDGTTTLADRGPGDCGVNASSYDAYYWDNDQWNYEGQLTLTAGTSKGAPTTLTGTLGAWELNYNFSSCEKPAFDQQLTNAALFGSRDGGVYMGVDDQNAVYLLWSDPNGGIGEYALVPPQ